MNRLSAHIGYLYTDLPLEDRPAAAARDGFTAVEHPEPWTIPAAEMRARLQDLGLVFAQVTSGMGKPGEKGLAALPGREAAFRDGFLRARDYALAIGCPFVHPMAGVPAGDDRAGRAGATYQANLDWALERLNGTGLRLLVEAITIPGYHLGSFQNAAAMQDRIGPGLALLFDTFHAATLGEVPQDWIRANAARIGHLHVADHPGRHEPGTGRLNFGAILGALRDTGYAGAIGFEYIPSRPDAASGTGVLVRWADLLAAPSAHPMKAGT